MSSVTIKSLTDVLNNTSRSYMNTEESIKKYIKTKLRTHNIISLPICRDDSIICVIRLKGNDIEIVDNIDMCELIERGFNKKMFLASIRKFNIDRRHKIIEEIQSYKTNSNEIVKFWV